ncbi:MAG: MerC domain-containing protein [Rhodospirillaceae bacterium]|nr:MerC domain-containing protein [Rhodospirillaceae bacterium]
MSASSYFDRVAIALSAICIVHCLAVTLLVALLPLAAFALGGHFHALMLWLVVPTSVIAFYLGHREHRRAAIGVAGGVGVALLTVTAVWGHGQWSGWAESGLSLVGSVVLVSAHWVNFQEVRRVHVHVHR